MDIDYYSPRGLNCLCGNLRMAARAVTRVYDDHLRAADMQASQLAVLWAVAGMPQATVKDIASQIAMHETALLRNLRVLEGRDWVSLDVGDDRRQRLVRLTPAGRRAFAKALPLWKTAQDAVDAVLEGSIKEINRKLLQLTRAVG
jgi:DNA-binding MarR family transcriptional regulator